jgi:hypothetical protein
MGLKVLAGIAACEDQPAAARVSAVALLLDRGWGKAPQTHTGENGESDVRITIRHIVEGYDGAPRAIEHEAKQIEVAQNDADEP